MKRKGDEYGQTNYRPSWQVLCLAGLVWALIIAVIVLWAGTAQAQTHDSAGRYILHGDYHARPSPHHSGGGNTAAAARYFLRIADRGPFRVEGEWFSAGLMVLALVAGPDAVEGSCLDQHVIMDMHEARGGPDNSNLTHNRMYSGVFTRPLRDFYHTARHSGQITVLRTETLTAADLGGMGYHVCEVNQ